MLLQYSVRWTRRCGILFNVYMPLFVFVFTFVPLFIFVSVSIFIFQPICGCCSGWPRHENAAAQFYLLPSCICIYVCLFLYLYLYLFPSCSAAAVGDLDKSAASQFYLPAGNFHLRHSLAREKYTWSTERNTLDQMAEIQLREKEKYGSNVYQISYFFFNCATLRLASSLLRHLLAGPWAHLRCSARKILIDTNTHLRNRNTRY